MDPITAALNLANAVLTLAGKVWDATPPAQQQQAASDWATFTHNVGAFIMSVKDKIEGTTPAASK